MKNLKLVANGSNLLICDDGSLVSKNVNYHKCSFCFDSDWEGLSKTAVFWQDDATYHTLLDADNSCVIPSETLKEGILYIGVFGTDITGKIVNTNPVYIRVFEGCMKDGKTPPEPTPDIYAQILSLIKAGGYVPQKTVITLYDADWDDSGYQTVTVSGVTLKSAVWVAPEPEGDSLAYYTANKTVCLYQGKDSLTFYREKSDKKGDISVNVMIFPESEGTK